MWVQNKMGTRPETALAQRSRRCFQNFWVTTGRLNFLWSNVGLVVSVNWVYTGQLCLTSDLVLK